MYRNQSNKTTNMNKKRKELCTEGTETHLPIVHRRSPALREMMDNHVHNINSHIQVLRKMRNKFEKMPSPVNSNIILREEKLKIDNIAMKILLAHNVALLKKIDHIQSTHGSVDTFYKPAKSKEKILEKDRHERREVQRENRESKCKIRAIKSLIGSSINEERQLVQPREFLNKCTDFVLSENMKMATKLLRPKIYLDLELKNIRPLGRIVVQLYTEVCPQVVLCFVRACTYQAPNDFKIIRIFPKLWVEGKLMGQSEAKSFEAVEYDSSVIGHGHEAGVLSFANNFINGFPTGSINFTISFKPLPLLNGRRVAFGLVTRGRRSIDILQDFGSKSGKIKEDIVIARSGLFYE